MSEFQETEKTEDDVYDVAVIGGGQAGLSFGFYLRRSGLRHVIFDAQNLI